MQVSSNSTGDLSGLPSPQEAADKLKGKVDEVGRNVQGAGSNNPLSGNVPSPQEVQSRACWGGVYFTGYGSVMRERRRLCCTIIYITLTLSFGAGRRQAEGQGQRGWPQGAKRRGQHLAAAQPPGRAPQLLPESCWIWLCSGYFRRPKPVLIVAALCHCLSSPVIACHCLSPLVNKAPPYHPCLTIWRSRVW